MQVKEISSLIRQVKNLKEENSSLILSQEKNKDNGQTVNDLSKEIESLEMQLSDLKEMNTLLNISVEELSNSQAELTKELKQKDADIALLQDRVGYIKENSSRLTETNELINQSFEEFSQIQQSQRDQLAQKESQLAELREKLVSLETELKDQQDINDQLTFSFDSFSQNQLDSIKEIEQKDNEISNLSRLLEASKKNVEINKMKIKTLKRFCSKKRTDELFNGSNNDIIINKPDEKNVSTLNIKMKDQVLEQKDSIGAGADDDLNRVQQLEKELKNKNLIIDKLKGRERQITKTLRHRNEVENKNDDKLRDPRGIEMSNEEMQKYEIYHLNSKIEILLEDRQNLKHELDLCKNQGFLNLL